MAGVTKVTLKVRHLAFWCVILSAAIAFAAPPKISKDLQKQSSQPWVNVIVQYRVPPSQKHFAKVAAKGGMLQQNLPLINGAAFTVKGNSVAALAKDSNVAYISLDRTVWATATVTDLYDQAVKVRFVERLRGEDRFDSVDALVAQMGRDVDACRTLLSP